MRILSPMGIDTLVGTMYFVGYALIPFVMTRAPGPDPSKIWSALATCRTVLFLAGANIGTPKRPLTSGNQGCTYKALQVSPTFRCGILHGPPKPHKLIPLLTQSYVVILSTLQLKIYFVWYNLILLQCNIFFGSLIKLKLIFLKSYKVKSIILI